MALDEGGRQKVLYWHNHYRSEITQGKTQNKTGYMPKGKTIKQMYYSEELENDAQAWADKCTYEHSGSSGESFYCFGPKYNDCNLIQNI